MSSQTCSARHHGRLDHFHHGALFYGNLDEFVEGTSSFVKAGLSAGEPVMVALLAEKISLLSSRLGGDARCVTFVDMAEVGRNPARIIPAWRRFVDQHPDSPSLWGIGEPIHAGRGAVELTECQRHEALVNVAFSGGRPWRLLCPYDTSRLDKAVLLEACRSHPYLVEEGRTSTSAVYESSPAVFAGALPEPPATAGEESFELHTLGRLRATVSRWALTVLPAARANDLVLAVHEAATNSVRHGGGRGCVRYWTDGRAAVVEVVSGGQLEDPLIGRSLAAPGDEAGRGLWLANQLCDLVQLRSSPQGTTVRLRISR